MAVTTRRAGYASVGGDGWDGDHGPNWKNDPAEDNIAILMIQRAGFPAFSPIHLEVQPRARAD